MTNSLKAFTSHKHGDTPLVCLTAYTTPMAQSLAPHVDLLLVGDSLGTVLYGMENTVGVTLSMMIAHGQAVMRAGADVPVIIDLPFGTYEDSVEQAVASARAVIDKTGADGVKLEGPYTEQIKAITDAGIAVMGHIGLQPQSVEIEGGYKIKGKTDEDTQRLIEEATMLAASGAFAFVLEGTKADAAAQVAKASAIPCIGIGASPECDGQVLVSEDLLGLHHGHKAKFVSEYAVLRDEVDAAVKRFAADVRNGRFPGDENLY